MFISGESLTLPNLQLAGRVLNTPDPLTYPFSESTMLGQMRDIGEETIRRIDWTELTPIVLLLRVFNAALGVRVLFFAMIGLWLTAFLNRFAGIVILKQEFSKPEHWEMIRLNVPLDVLNPALVNAILSIQQNPTLLFWWLPCIVLIWIFCGGMICRMVAVRFTIDESESTINLFRFFRKRGISFVSSLIILVLGILCCFLPVKIAGWLLAVPGLKYVVAVLLPIPLVFAFFTVILTLGLAIGFMMLFAAVSVDGSDGFDAISRMFSYIFQRPLHYLLYWACCGILGWFGVALLQVLTRSTVKLYWSSATGPDLFLETFWLTLVWSIPVAYVFAWFWTSSVAIYLLLRRSVDATPLNEVYRVSPPKVRTLPTIKQDERGAPEMAKEKE